MGWIEKGKATPFDNQPINGLFFLDGDMLARKFNQKWTEGQKYPTIVFPGTRIEFSLWESGSPEALAIVHLFGEMDLPLRSTCKEAWEQANDIAEQCGYLARRVSDAQLEVVGHDIGEHLIISYDNEGRWMTDVEVVREKRQTLPLPPLLDEKSRKKLPVLYANEKKGLEATAQVKFFTPDSNWTWYASEFDGEDLFFGLVAGLDVELGYFSLKELEEARGPLGLPIERDRYFEPITLKELKQQHQRGGE